MNVIPLSKHLGLERSDLEDHGVLDVDLGIDTKFFIDPLLLETSDISEFEGSRKKNLEYFSQLIKMVKVSNLSDQLKQKALKMLAIEEPAGLSIGYGNKSDGGTSISLPIAAEIIKNLTEIIRVGVEDPTIVEILSMFIPGYGPDSISDLTAHILYEDFCLFTQRVASELKVKTSDFQINGKKFLLPKHPFRETQIIFIPNSIICPLPIATDWEQVQDAAAFNDALRNRVGKVLFQTLLDDIHSIRSKSDGEIAEIKTRLDTLISIYKEIEVKPYDLNDDDIGYYSIAPAVETASKSITPSKKPSTNDELIDCVRDLLNQFKRSVEDNGLNKVLYDTKKKPRREEIAQLTFYSLADIYCKVSDFFLARESNAGRGGVDFALGTGYKSKVVVELKKSNNKQLLSGFLKQVEVYKQSEAACYSFYVVIMVKKGSKDDQLSQIKIAYEKKKEEGKAVPELFIIDGLLHPSASKLK